MSVSFDGVARTKNMFAFSEARAEQQLHYRTFMMNMVWPPKGKGRHSRTFAELADGASSMWDTYQVPSSFPASGVPFFVLNSILSCFLATFPIPSIPHKELLVGGCDLFAIPVVVPRHRRPKAFGLVGCVNPVCSIQ